jgi:hypothetical protein
VNKLTQYKSYWKREKPDGFSLSFLMAILILLFSTNIFAQYNHHKIYESLLNGRFNERLPDWEITEEENLNNKSSAASVIALTLEAFFSGEPSKINKAIEITDEFLDLSDDIAYNLIIGHTAEAILKSMHGKYLPAVFSFYNAYHKIKSYEKNNSCIEPVIFELNQFYNLTFSKVPDSYTRFLSIAGIRPINIDTNKICHQQNQRTISSTFSTIFQLLNKQTPIKIPRQPGEMSKLIAGIYYLGKQNPDSALLYLNNMDTIRSSLITLNYYKGLAYLNKGDYKSANWYFDKYLLLQQSGRYIKATLLRKKWITIIQNQSSIKITQDILTRGSELSYLDKQAMKEAEKEYVPALLQARILYDGAKFQKSLEIIEQIDIEKLNASEYTSMLYRKARNLQGLKKYNAAIAQYDLLLKQKNEGEYFHKKAVLEIGKIYIELENPQLALKYLEEVKNIDSDTFNEAFEQEAEILIDKLKKEIQ